MRNAPADSKNADQWARAQTTGEAADTEARDADTAHNQTHIMEGENAGSAEKIAPEPNIEKPEEPLHIRTMASDLLLHAQTACVPAPLPPEPTPGKRTPRAT